MKYLTRLEFLNSLNLTRKSYLTFNFNNEFQSTKNVSNQTYADFHDLLSNKHLKFLEVIINVNYFYHYTKSDRMQKIYKSEMIRAMPLRHLQLEDSEEFFNGVKYFKEIVQNSGGVELFEKFFNFLEKELLFKELNFYILSTTAQSGSSLHVEKYSSNNPCSFVLLDKNIIHNNQMLKNEFMYSGYVIYDDQLKFKKMYSFYNDFKLILNFLYQSGHNMNPRSKEIREIYLAAFQVVVILSSLFKNKDKYFWENEYRFVIFRGSFSKKYKAFYPLSF